MTKAPLVLHGYEWTAKPLSVAMAYAALRLCLGGDPKPFTRSEVLLWVALMAGDEARAGLVDALAALNGGEDGA